MFTTYAALAAHMIGQSGGRKSSYAEPVAAELLKKAARRGNRNVSQLDIVEATRQAEQRGVRLQSVIDALDEAGIIEENMKSETGFLVTAVAWEHATRINERRKSDKHLAAAGIA